MIDSRYVRIPENLDNTVILRPYIDFREEHDDTAISWNGTEYVRAARLVGRVEASE